MTENNSKAKGKLCSWLVTLFIIFQLVSLCCVQPIFGIVKDAPSPKGGLTEGAGLPFDGSVPQDPKTALVALAEKRFSQGQWEEAARCSLGVLNRSPENGKAREILAATYAITGQRDLAEKTLAPLQRSKEEGFYLSLTQAILKAQLGSFTEAEQKLGDALGKQPKHPVAVYYKGSLKLAQGQLGEAEKFFKAALTLQGKFAPALAGLGQVFFQQQKLKEAAQSYQAALQEEPEIALYRKQLIEIYQALGDKEAVDREKMQFLYHMPGVKQSYLTRGMALLSEGSYAEAVSLMDKVISIYKRAPEALYIKAAAQINLKDGKAAAGNIRDFIAQQWGVPQAHHYAGMCYLAMKDLDKAEQQFKTAVVLDPKMGKSFVPMTVIEQVRGNFVRALNGLSLAKREGEPASLIEYLEGHILLTKGDREAFKRTMTGGAQLVPGLTPEMGFPVPNEKERVDFARERNLMVIYFFNGWYGMTIQASERLLRLDKRDVYALYYGALSHVAHKNVEGAMKSFDQLLSAQPNLLAAHMGIGRLYMGKGDYQKAADAFKKAVQTNPDDAPALTALGDSYSILKDERSAYEAYTQATRANPRDSVSHQRVAMLLSARPDQLDEALKYAQKAVSLEPNGPYALDTLGWVYLQRGDADQALPSLKEASRLLPQDPLVQYHLGMAYYKNKAFAEAKEKLEYSLRLSKEFKGAKEAEEALKEMSNKMKQ